MLTLLDCLCLTLLDCLFFFFLSLLLYTAHRGSQPPRWQCCHVHWPVWKSAGALLSLIRSKCCSGGTSICWSGRQGPILSLSLLHSWKMRCDLLQWEQAIQLASSLAPRRLPAISREYAQQLEFLCVTGRVLTLLHFNTCIYFHFSFSPPNCSSGLQW